MARIDANSGEPSLSGSSENVSKTDLEATEKRIYSRLAESERIADERQVKSVEVLGIFMAFLSFIAVNVQIFNRVSSALSAGLFTLLMFCLLAILIILMDVFLKGDIEIDRRKKGVHRLLEFLRDYRIQFILFFSFIALASIVMLRSFALNPVPGTIEFDDLVTKKIENKIEYELHNNIYTKDQIDEVVSFCGSDLEKNFKEFKECLKSGGWNRCL